jgi:septal ring factor EnvC (AmiA/AmiB activator)
MARRMLLGLLCLLVLAAPAAAGDIHRKKREIDDRISSLQLEGRARDKRRRASSRKQITVVDAKITSLRTNVSRAQSRLNELEAQLATSQASGPRPDDGRVRRNRRASSYSSVATTQSR